MADMDLGALINATPSLIEQLGKAFLELEGHKDVAQDKVQWKEIEEHFRQLETTLLNKHLELEVRKKAFREEESEARELLELKDAAVASKEQDLFDQIQELKDAAVDAIKEAGSIHQPPSLELSDVGDNKEGQVSSFLGDTNALHPGPEEKSSDKTDENAEVVPDEVKPRPELLLFCELMDAKALMNFIMENHKNIPSLRDELPLALESATEPGRLVLASLEGFFPPDETTQEGDKNDAALQGMRQSCLMLMESIATLLAKADLSDHLLDPEIKQQAKAIANEWKPKLAGAGIDACNGNSLEAEAFLQLLASFRIASEFDEEELCKFVLSVSCHRRAPELCRSLGLTHKMPGIVEALISSGKPMDAVHFIHAFQLTESFPIVPLLKAYLKDLRRNSQGKNDGNVQELAALKAITQCVKDYKLEADYPLDPLERRVLQLEHSHPEKKRFFESGKHQNFKKPRANGGFHGSRAPGGHIPPIYGEQRATHAGMTEVYPQTGPTAYDYQAPTQPTYAQQPYDQRTYYAAAATYNTPTYDASAAAAAVSNYGSYTASGVQSSYQPYMG